MSKVLVVDLDDTLYSELEYLKSAYAFIANNLSVNNAKLYELMISKYFNNENVLQFLSDGYDVDKQTLLDWYRFHIPRIELYANARQVLEDFSKSGQVALITDGRSKTQRNKISALNLNSLLTSIVISAELGSEKPCKDNFVKVMLETVGTEYIYIGDNLKKDFITPKSMGWTTICLKDQGQNIHKQDSTLPDEYQPEHCFESWLEIQDFLIKS